MSTGQILAPEVNSILQDHCTTCIQLATYLNGQQAVLCSNGLLCLAFADWLPISTASV